MSGPRALVVGAGPAGLAAAMELASWCHAVTVLESRDRGQRRGAGEHLPPHALAEIVRHGLGELIASPRHDRSPGSRSAWGDFAPMDKEYFASLPGHGLNLDRREFDARFVEMAERRGVSVLHRTRLEGLRAENRGPEPAETRASNAASPPDAPRFVAALRTPDGGAVLHADVVVDATGRRAVAATLLGAERRRLDDLVALTGRVEGCLPNPSGGRIRIEATADGWWHAVQFSDGTVLATLLTDPDVIRDGPTGGEARAGRGDRESAGGRSAAIWERSLHGTRLVSRMTGSGTWDGSVTAFDAATQFLDFPDAPAGFLAAGDAAAAWDPMASWGITKAVTDGAAAAHALRAWWGGEMEAVPAHLHAGRAAFAAYRSRQLDFYRAETRWPDAPFWRVRQFDTPVPMARQEA